MCRYFSPHQLGSKQNGQLNFVLCALCLKSTRFFWLQRIMMQNIDEVLGRGDKLDSKFFCAMCNVLLPFQK